MKEKATAIAHTMEGLVKYHGLKDWDLRIPYHDSISVNLEALWTKTTVEFGNFQKDTVSIDDRVVSGHALERCCAILNEVRRISKMNLKAKVTSKNNIDSKSAKGLGYSSSAGAALATAAFKAASLDDEYGWDMKIISRIARRLAGSACRSVVGEYARWFAGSSDETSYGTRIASSKELELAIIVVPLPSKIRTEDAHRDVETSPFFEARLNSAERRIEHMIRAIKKGNLESVGEMAEADSLELHGVTMTGDNRIIIYEPDSIRVINEVLKIRKNGIPAYFSMQTGPSVFINTYPKYAKEVQGKIDMLGLKTILSRIGGEAKIITL